MLIPGLASVTLRAFTPEKIIQLAADGGLKCIEWGGDIHVPVGEINRAGKIGCLTREAGLAVAAYGSYYRLGAADEAGKKFEDVLRTAAALGAPTIRVWAGVKGSEHHSEEERQRVVDDAVRVADLASHSGLTVSLEYHADTLTDTRASVLRLMKELNSSPIDFLWQPSNGESVEACAARLRDVLPRLRNIHAFHWWPTAHDRHPLVDGEAQWRSYLDIVRSRDRPVDVLLEFVARDSPKQLAEDASTLRRWLQ